MDHDLIERRQLVDRYLMGRLSDEEAEQFEEHYLHCQQCVEQLELAAKLQRGLKRAVAADGARLAAVRLGLLARLARLSRGRQLAVGLSVLLVAITLPTALGIREAGRFARQRDAARAALGEERQLRGTLEAELERSRQPQANVALLSIGPERGGVGDEPTHRLRLGRERRWIVLALELDRVEAGSYGVSLVAAAGDVLWRGEGLEPDHLDSLVLGLPSTRLEAGDYRLEVERRTPSGDVVPTARFALRILP